MSNKPTNPKDAVGVSKVPASVTPRNVLAGLNLAMFEGARKYGRHNYRDAGVRASVYFDALNRHMDAWWEGQDIDPDSGVHHAYKAMACLVILMDCIENKSWVDDRPPKAPAGWMDSANTSAKRIIKQYPDAEEAHVEATENN